MQNPFRPGTASVPPVLAGRDRVLDPVDIALSSHGNNYGSFFAVHGPRGLGKTSLLHETARRAGEADWATVRYEVPHGSKSVIRPLLDQLAELDHLPNKLKRSVASARREWGEQEQTLDLRIYRRTARREPPPEIPITEQFSDVVMSVAAHMSDRSSGLLLAIDEVQNTEPAELSVLGPTVQRLSERGDLTVMIALAGLSSLPGHVARAFTYSERWVFHPLQNLTTSDAARALAIPAADTGKPFTAAAVDVAAELSGGYPFTVQLIGFHAWNLAPGDSIDTDIVHRAHQQSLDHLNNGLFAQRWEAASPLSKAYLAAASAHDGSATTSTIAAALHRSSTQLSSTRAALIDAGTIVATADGSIAEAIPGLFAYIRAHPDHHGVLERAVHTAPNSSVRPEADQPPDPHRSREP